MLFHYPPKLEWLFRITLSLSLSQARCFEKWGAIQTRVVWNTNAIPHFTWIQMKHSQPFKKVPQPTTKKWETHYKGASIIFHYAPTIDSKKKSILGELLTILHLYLEIGEAWRGLLAFFRALSSMINPSFDKKLKEKEKAGNMELECDFDCNLSRGNN